MFGPVRTFLVLFAFLVVPSGSAKTQECNCGYGGACMRVDSGVFSVVADVGCDVCERISGGFYENCSVIVDHCKTTTCANNGTCRSTWGSYFCDCLPGYFGQNCNNYEPSLTRIDLSSKVYAYYQIQPDSDGISTFHIIYDPGDRTKLLEDYGIEIVPIVRFSDNRVYYPVREAQFLLKNTKKLCHAEALADKELYDLRICDLLPDGEVWTFTFDATLYGQQPNVYDNKWGDIGVRGTLKFEILMSSSLKDVHYGIFSQFYNIFTYSRIREPYKCRINISFDGCGRDRDFPTKYSRALPLKIAAIKEVRSCNGSMPFAEEWYRQKNVLRQKYFEFDQVPIQFEFDEGNYDDTYNFIHIPAFYFEAGVHMIQFAYVLRGEPPHYGSKRIIKLFSHCWIQILQSIPWFETAGGREGTASCNRPLELRVLSKEPTNRVEEFDFTSTCNDTNDEECSSRGLQGNILKKLRTPCGTYLNFTVVASHRLHQVSGVTFWASVHFITTTFGLFVECLYNCAGTPIDPSYRVLLSAHTKPQANGIVNWTVTVNGKEIAGRDGVFDHVFHESTGSRVIRMNGYRFKLRGESTPEVQVTVERYLYRGETWSATLFTLGDDLDSFAKDFKLEKVYGGDEYVFRRKPKSASHRWEPIKYRIYSVFEKLGAYSLKVDTTYEALLIFLPSSNMSEICLLDPFMTEICSLPLKVDFVPRDVTLDDCSAVAQTGDYIGFMDLAITFLTNNLYTFNAPSMEWKIPVEVHISILDLLHNLQNAQRVDAYEQHTMMSMIQMLSMIFYSEVGCKDQNMIVPFKNREGMHELRSLSIYFQMRSKAKTVLREIIKLFDEYSQGPRFKLLRCPLGDPIQMMVRAWTLLYLSDFVGFKQKEPTDLTSLYLLGEATYWYQTSLQRTLNLLLDISPTMSRLSYLFVGLRTIGTESVRTWMTRCTYKCILSYLKKSEPVFENYTGYINHLFVPLNNSSKTGHWMIPIEVELPETLIPGGEFMEFSLVVWAAKNRPNDWSWTPSLYFEIRDQHGNMIIHMPEGLSYNVSLPPMIGGREPTMNGHKVAAERLLYEAYTFEQPSDPTQRPKGFVAFKITLPINIKNWNITLFTVYNFRLKGKASIGEPPDYNEVIESPEWKGHPGSLGNESGFTYNTTLHPEDGKYLTVIYLGFILAASEPPGVYKIFIQTKIVVCLIRDIFKGNLRCETIRGGSGGDQAIKCRCKDFGITFGVPLKVRYSRLLTDEIVLNVPNQLRYASMIIGIVMVVSVAIFPLTAWLLEKMREAKASFVFLDNEYPTDTYRIVIGVHTGMNLLAGTWSDVAIRLIGRSGSSRVFVLRSRRHKKMLTWGSDYWFLVNTSPSVGQITHVMIWHDFRYISDWYCSHIMIRDQQTSQWYHVTVKRWFQIYPSDEESRMVVLPVKEFKELEEDLKVVEKRFNTYYFKELRNNHLPFCMFSLHYRSVTTHEQKFLIYLVKLMTISLIAWGFQDLGLSWVMYQLELTADSLTSISWGTIAIITAIAVATRIFTFPLSIMYRWILKSKLLMSKTTTKRSRSRGSHVSGGSYDRNKKSTSTSSHVMFISNEPRKDADTKKSKQGRALSIVEQPKKSKEPVPQVERKTINAKAADRNFNKMTFGSKNQRDGMKRSVMALDARFDGKNPEVRTPNELKKGKEGDDHGSRSSPVLHRKTSGSPHGSLTNLVRHQHNQERTSFLGHKPSCSTIVVGPTLFRSVNTSPSIFKVRSRVNTLEARCSVGIIALLIFVYFLYEERTYERIHYWNRGYVFLFFSLMALLIDTILLEPFFIFTKSFLAFSFFHMSNNDLNLWNRNKKIEVIEARTVTWKEYVKKATRKEYKPILSSELNVKRRQQRQLRFFQLSLLYMCMIAIAYNCYETLIGGYYSRNQQIYREAILLTNSERTIFVNNSIGIEDVHSPEELLKYLITNFAMKTFTWNNGKPISLKAKYWDKARLSIPLGATNMILLLISPTRGNQSVPPEFLKYFSHPKTYYNRLIQEKSPVFLDEFEWKFISTNNRSLIQGRSRDYYPMRGHTRELSFRAWPRYFASIRSGVTAVAESEHIVPRAIIFTTNYFSPNLPGISTVDLVVEFRPSGTCTGKLYVYATRMYGNHRGILYSSGDRGTPVLLFRIVTGALLVVLISFNVAVILKIGIKTYFTEFHWIIRALFLVSCFLNAFSSAFLLDVKYRKVHQILHDVESQYTDAHDVYEVSELYDKLFLGLVLFFLGIEAMCVIHSMMSSERLVRVFTKCAPLIFSLTIIGIWSVTLYCIAHFHHDQRTFPLAVDIYLRFLLPIDEDNRTYAKRIPIIIIVVIILSKFSTAFVIQTYTTGTDLQDKTDDLAEQLPKEGICKHRAVLTWLKMNGNKRISPDAKNELLLTETKSKHPHMDNKPPSKNQQKKIDVLNGKLSLIMGKK